MVWQWGQCLYFRVCSLQDRQLPDNAGTMQRNKGCICEKVWHCRYDFTEWAVSLNTMSPGLEKLLPPSDMRWRKDVRALEEGRYGKVWRFLHSGSIVSMSDMSAGYQQLVLVAHPHVTRMQQSSLKEESMTASKALCIS